MYQPYCRPGLFVQLLNSLDHACYGYKDVLMCRRDAVERVTNWIAIPQNFRLTAWSVEMNKFDFLSVKQSKVTEIICAVYMCVFLKVQIRICPPNLASSALWYGLSFYFWMCFVSSVWLLTQCGLMVNKMVSFISN